MRKQSEEETLVTIIWSEVETGLLASTLWFELQILTSMSKHTDFIAQE